MAEQFLTQLLRMSLSGAAATLVVIAARALLKRAPRAVVCVLWAVVLFRLLCPFAIESAVGLLPAQPQTAQGSGIVAQSAAPSIAPQAPVQAVSTVNAENPTQIGKNDAEPAFSWWTAGVCVWAAGAAGLGLYSVLSLVRLKRKLRGARQIDKGVYAVAELPTAFVLGVFRPVIYLPEGLDERDRCCILMHEHTHIRRGDHIWKLVMQLALCVHWFNPVVWLCSALAGRDLETACDEAVIRRLGPGVKRQYSEALLRMAAGRAAGVPLAFGQGDTKGRVKNVLRYKKPALWAVIAAAGLVAGLCVDLACNRPAKKALASADGAIYEWDGSTMDALPEGCVALDASEPLRKQGFQAVYGDGAEMRYLLCDDGRILPLHCIASDGSHADGQYDILLVQDARIARIERTRADGGTEVIDVAPGASGLYVLEGASGAEYSFYDEAGNPVQPEGLPADRDVQADSGFAGIQYVSDGQVRFERDLSGENDALTSFLGCVYGNVLVRSAAWPASAETLPDEYVRVTMQDGTELLCCELAELGRPVVQLNGMWMTLDETDWQLLRRAATGVEQPEVWSAARCSGGVALTEALMQPPEALAQDSLWEGGADAAPVQSADLDSDCFLVTRTALDGSRRQAAVYERDGKVLFRLMTDETGAELTDGQQVLEQLDALLPDVSVVKADLDGDGLQDVAWWRARSADIGEVTLHVTLGNGRVLTHPVQAMWGHSLTAADVTGDGIPELIAMADTGGVGGMGCFALEVLRVRDGALESLPLPFQTEEGAQNGDWFNSGFHFETRYEEGFRLHVRSELLDRVIDFSEDAAMVRERIEVGQFDETGRLLHTEDFADSGCDGICAYELVVYDRSPGLELRVYQYLWQWSHVDGAGFGVTVLRWDETALEFAALEQYWAGAGLDFSAEAPWLTQEDADGDGRAEQLWWETWYPAANEAQISLCALLSDGRLLRYDLTDAELSGVQEMIIQMMPGQEQDEPQLRFYAKLRGRLQEMMRAKR